MKNGVDEQLLSSFAGVANTGFMESPEQSAAIILRNYALSHPTTGENAANELCACAEMAIKDYINHNPRRNAYKRKAHIYVRNEEAKYEQRAKTNPR